MSYKVVWAKDSVKKQFYKFPEDVVDRIKPKLLNDLKNPFKISGIKKVKGAKDSYRIRIGDYRVVFEIKTKQKHVIIIEIEKKPRAYRSL